MFERSWPGAFDRWQNFTGHVADSIFDQLPVKYPMPSQKYARTACSASLTYMYGPEKTSVPNPWKFKYILYISSVISLLIKQSRWKMHINTWLIFWSKLNPNECLCLCFTTAHNYVHVLRSPLSHAYTLIGLPSYCLASIVDLSAVPKRTPVLILR